jgi:type I thyroxine 5'-deiodinase
MRTSIPVLIDEIDNEVARQYGGYPDRLYLIGKDGRIAFQGGPGPFGLRPGDLERAIDAELASAAAP